MENLESQFRQCEGHIVSQMEEVLKANTTYRSRILLIRELLNRHDNEVRKISVEVLAYSEVELPF